MSGAKRYSLQLSEETMTFFKQIHKERKAKNIGLSIKESILALRKQLEERSETPLVHPLTGTPLSKDESAYIQRIQREKGFQTVREAFTYFEGRLEGRIEKRLGTKALEQTLSEASKEASKVAETTALIEHIKERAQQCRFYRFDNKRQLVECSKDFITKNRNYWITEQTCDWCWNNPKCPGRRTEHQELPTETNSENSEAS